MDSKLNTKRTMENIQVVLEAADQSEEKQKQEGPAYQVTSLNYVLKPVTGPST